MLSGTDVKDAKAAVAEDDLKNKTNVVSLSFTKEGTKNSQKLQRLHTKQEMTPLVFTMTEALSVCQVYGLKSKMEARRLTV